MRSSTPLPIRPTRANILRDECIKKKYNTNPSSRIPTASVSYSGKVSGRYRPPDRQPFNNDLDWSVEESTTGRHSSLDNGSQRSRASIDLSCNQRTVDLLKSGGRFNSKDLGGVRNRSDAHYDRMLFEDKNDVHTNDFQMQPQYFSSNYQLRNLSTIPQRYTTVDRSPLQRPTFVEQLRYSYNENRTSVNYNPEEYSTPISDNVISNINEKVSTRNGQDASKNLNAVERKVQSISNSQDSKSSNTSNFPTGIHQSLLQKMSYSDMRKHTFNERLKSYNTSLRSDSVPDLDLKPNVLSSNKKRSASAADSVPGVSDTTRGGIENKTQPYTSPTEQNAFSQLSRDHETTDTNHHVSSESIGPMYQNELSPETAAQGISGRRKLVDIPLPSEEKENESDRKVSEAANLKQEESEVNLNDNLNINKEMGTNDMRQSFDKNASGENPVKLSHGEGRLKLQNAGQHNNYEQDEIAMHQHQSSQHQNAALQSTFSSQQHAPISSQMSSLNTPIEVQDRKISYLKNVCQDHYEKGMHVYIPRSNIKGHIGRIHSWRKSYSTPRKGLVAGGRNWFWEDNVDKWTLQLHSWHGMV